MKKNIFITFLCTLLMTIGFANDSSPTSNDSIAEIYFSNLRYSKGKLFNEHRVKQKSETAEKEITQEFELPDSLTAQFLALINNSHILSIRSNKRNCMDCIPFILNYIKTDGSMTEIMTFPSNSTNEERQVIDSFYKAVKTYTDYKYTSFRDSLPDGNYISIRRTGYLNEWKEYGKWQLESDFPLYILDGEIILHSHWRTLGINDTNDSETEKYSVKKLNGDAETAIYGTKARNGVLLIRSKK